MSRPVSNQGIHRRSPGVRRTDSVTRLLTAALEEVRAVGYDTLTVRSVAARARVAPATAYTYFASKSHLIAQVFARELDELPVVATRVDSPLARLQREFTHLAAFLGREPELAAAAPVAMLAADPDVARLRMHTASIIAGRLRAALGDAATDNSVEALSLVWSGSLLQAGLGHQTWDEMALQLTRAAELIVNQR